MTSKFQLLPSDIEDRLEELPQKLASIEGLAALWLFGSFARGEATPISDVDLAYVPDAALQGEELDRFETRLYTAISGALHTDDFTFMNLRRAPAYFAWPVITEGERLFCRDDKMVAALVEAVCGRAPDVAWLRRVGNADFLETFEMEERTVDRDRVSEFLRLISDDLQILREKSRVSKGDYLNSRDLQAVVERRLQTANESAINIGNHMIARLGFRPPQDYADVFRILGENQVLRRDVADAMMDMAKFRNLLVHVYWAIDHERVYDSLPGRLATLEEFAQHIVRWLKQQDRGAQ